MTEELPTFEEEARAALAWKIIEDFGRGDIDGAKRKIQDSVLNTDLSSDGRQQLMRYLIEQIQAAPTQTEQQAQDKAGLHQFIDQLLIPPLTNKSRQ